MKKTARVVSKKRLNTTLFKDLAVSSTPEEEEEPTVAPKVTEPVSDEESSEPVRFLSTSPIPSFRILQKILSESSYNRLLVAAEFFSRLNSNYVRSTKYTLVNFLPMILFEQFKRLSNIYFLVIMLLNFIPGVGPSVPITSTLPLCFILGTNIIKDALEDFLRWLSDRKANGREIMRLDVFKLNESDWRKRFVKGRTCDLQAGDLVLLESEDYGQVPADLVVIHSSNDDDVVYMETANLDGETNLKKRKCVKLSKKLRSLDQLTKTRFEVVMEENSKNLGQGKGTMKRAQKQTNVIELEEIVNIVEGEEQVSETTDIEITNNNMLLKGCVLKNTEEMVGLVAFVGRDTKMALNLTKSKRKTGQMDIALNKIVFVLFVIQQCTIFMLMLISYLYNEFISEKSWYLDDIPMLTVSWYDPKAWYNTPMYFLLSWMTFFLLFEIMIPMSLFVTMEIIKAVNSRFMEWSVRDNEEREGEIVTTAMASKSSDLNFDLAFVDMIFSDKTGTLTRNLMKYLKCFCFGKVYATKENHLHDVYKQTNNEKEKRHIMRFLETLVLNNTVDPKFEDGVLSYTWDSTDEITLVRDLAGCVGGVVLCGKEDSTEYEKIIEIDCFGEKRVYKLLELVKFTSARKRMSVIVETPEKKIYIFAKGADSEMFRRMAEDGENVDDFVESTEQFSWDGLRTLVYGYKKISKEQFQNFQEDYSKAKARVKGKKEEMAKTLEKHKIEQGFKIVGVTGIEDKLQEGVPDALKKILEADVPVWILTGDKTETAVNIAYNANVIQKDEGDGANDVSMIQEAKIGVGLFGLEGSEAARSADYALPKFKYLVDLLFVEGRYSYVRSADTILISFYKNAIIAITNLIFVFFNGFTGKLLIDQWIFKMYNTLFHSLPPASFGFFEEDLPREILLESPELYKSLKNNPFFNVTRVANFICLGAYHAFVCFFVAYLATWDGITVGVSHNGVHLFGHVVSFACMTVSFVTYIVETKKFTIVGMAFILGSYALYLLWIWITSLFSSFFQVTEYHMIPHLAQGNIRFYEITFFSICISILPHFITKFSQQKWIPKDWQIFRKNKKYFESESNEDFHSRMTKKIKIRDDLLKRSKLPSSSEDI